MKPSTTLRAASLGLAAALMACTSPGGNASSATGEPGGRPGGVISVGSFDFPESVLLAEIYGQALAAARFPVRIMPNLGPREVVDPALMDGLLQVVPEYAGSALEFFSLGKLSATSNSGAATKALAGLVAGGGLVAARPAPHKTPMRSWSPPRPRPAMTCGRSLTSQRWRRDATARYGPRLLTTLNRVSALLDTSALRALDARVEIAGQDPRVVARSFLRARGLIPAGGEVR